jgi:hypothetical protein
MRAQRKEQSRTAIPAARLDRYLTEQLHRAPGFESVSVSAGYRLSAPDVEGCNWSGKFVLLRGPRAPSSEAIAAALRPILRWACARFNMSE